MNKQLNMLCTLYDMIQFHLKAQVCNFTTNNKHDCSIQYEMCLQYICIIQFGWLISGYNSRTVTITVLVSKSKHEVSSTGYKLDHIMMPIEIECDSYTAILNKQPVYNQ